MQGQYPKHFDAFRGQHFDCIVTVCDRARELCPTFLDGPEPIHWSFSDPAAIKDSDEEQYQAFEQTALKLNTRIRFLIITLKQEHTNKITDNLNKEG